MESLCLEKEYRELEECYKVNYTSKILTTEPEDRHPVIKEMVQSHPQERPGTPAAVSFESGTPLPSHKDSGVEDTLRSCPWLWWSMCNITQEPCTSHELSAACQPSMFPIWGNWTNWDTPGPCHQWTHNSNESWDTLFGFLLNLDPSIIHSQFLTITYQVNHYCLLLITLSCFICFVNAQMGLYDMIIIIIMIINNINHRHSFAIACNYNNSQVSPAIHLLLVHLIDWGWNRWADWSILPCLIKTLTGCNNHYHTN